MVAHALTLTWGVALYDCAMEQKKQKPVAILYVGTARTVFDLPPDYH